MGYSKNNMFKRDFLFPLPFKEPSSTLFSIIINLLSNSYPKVMASSLSPLFLSNASSYP
jgi:hypothetical protein